MNSNKISHQAEGSKVSRKEFLGLLGAGAGALMLPGKLSGSESCFCIILLLPIVKNRKTRISFLVTFLPWAPAWGDQKFADQRLEELVQFGHEAGIDSVQFFVNTFRHSYYVLPPDVECQQSWIDWMREVVAPRIRAEGFGLELNFQQLLGATTSNTDLRPLYKWKQFMVDHYGKTSEEFALSRGPGLPRRDGENCCVRLVFDQAGYSLD